MLLEQLWGLVNRLTIIIVALACGGSKRHSRFPEICILDDVLRRKQRETVNSIVSDRGRFPYDNHSQNFWQLSLLPKQCLLRLLTTAD